MKGNSRTTALGNSPEATATEHRARVEQPHYIWLPGQPAREPGLHSFPGSTWGFGALFHTSLDRGLFDPWANALGARLCVITARPYLCWWRKALGFRNNSLGSRFREKTHGRESRQHVASLLSHERKFISYPRGVQSPMEHICTSLHGLLATSRAIWAHGGSNFALAQHLGLGFHRCLAQ